MIGRKAYLLGMMMAYVCMTYASPSFYTQRLKCIAQVVGIQLPDTLQPEKEYTGIWTFKQRSLRVRTNAFGDVSHIGYCLFDERIYQHCEYKAALDFVERYALELTLDMSKELWERLRITDKVTCVEGSLSMLVKVTPHTPVTIDQRERRMFRVKWTIDPQTMVILSFPADYQLITGADAIELEKILERDVQRIIPMTQDNLLTDWNDEFALTFSEWAEAEKLMKKHVHIDWNYSTTKGPDGFYVVNMWDSYLNKEIRRYIVLLQKDGKRSLYLDSKLPLFSVRNLLLTGQFPTIVPLKLTIDCYGNKKRYLDTVSLQQFVDLCHMEGCELYVGIKQKNDTEITAVVFALNPAMAYNHVLSVKVPLRVLQEKNVPISGILYAYIPLQNITEKFFTQDLNN